MLTVFENRQRYGLRRGDEAVLPALYDAVWPLLNSFWGFRRGDSFGVLAADGTVICPCLIPAVYPGFAELTIDDELAAVLESDATFLAFMQAQFPGLHNFYGRLCKPARWWAEVATPLLANEAQELFLLASDRSLVLKGDGTWAWRMRCSEAPMPPLLFAAQEPATLTLAKPHEFTVTNEVDLLRWRKQLTDDEIDVEFTDDDYSLPLDVWVVNEQAETAHWNALAAVLASSGIGFRKLGAGPSPAFYIPFTLATLAPSVLAACTAHLTAFFAAEVTNNLSVERLIYLAWLWANGFVTYNLALGQHQVDSRYDFAANWFDSATIDALYQDYELDKLLPLLRLPPQSLA